MSSHAEDRLMFYETDEANQPVASYVYSEQNVPATKRDAPTVGRLDVMVSRFHSWPLLMAMRSHCGMS